MLYLKLPAGTSKWEVFPADNVRYDSTYYQVPEDLRRSGDVEWGSFLAERGVLEAQVPPGRGFVCVPYLFSEHKDSFSSEMEDCVRWALRQYDGVDYLHVFQGDGYLLSDTGATLERI